jgi:hypothetical protein
LFNTTFQKITGSNRWEKHNSISKEVENHKELSEVTLLWSHEECEVKKTVSCYTRNHEQWGNADALFINMPAFSIDIIDSYLSNVLSSFQDENIADLTWVSGQLSRNKTRSTVSSNKIDTLLRDPHSIPHSWLKKNQDDDVRLFAAEKAIFQVQLSIPKFTK